VIATGFGPSRRQRRREQRQIGGSPSRAVSSEGGFEVSPDVLDVPSFLRDD
jgi:hypothetical protein